MNDDERTIEVETQADGVVQVSLAYPKARDVKKGFSMYLELLKLESEADAEDAKAALLLNDYLEHVDEMAARAIGKDVDWLDELSDEDKNRITGWYDERVKKRADFMRSSGSAPTS